MDHGSFCQSSQFLHQFIESVLFQKRFHDFQPLQFLHRAAAFGNVRNLHFECRQIGVRQFGMNVRFQKQALHNLVQFTMILTVFLVQFLFIFCIRREQSMI